jgi:hypothetical protein
MATSDAMKLAKMAAREADKQRAFAIMTNPAVVSTVTLLGGLYLANHIRWDKDYNRNTDVRAIAMAGIAVGAMAAAGIRDKYVLGGFGVAAGVAGLNPVKFPSVSASFENVGLGADAKLFGANVPGLTPGHPWYEWLMGPIATIKDLVTGKGLTI